LSNFESSKLLISNPSFHNFVILFILFVTTLVFTRRKPTAFLDITQTNELKGFAIMMVVTGHLWVHVSKEPASLILGDVAVSLFLILSGFGLTLSVEKTPVTFKRFVGQRLSRVMAPYWVATGVILILDYLVLDKTYSLPDISSTLAGINGDRSVRDLDYARWFISLLLLEYIAFFVANRFLPRFEAILSLCVFSVLLMVLKHYHLLLLGSFHNMMAFPLGCLLAYYIKAVTRFVFAKANHKKLVVFVIFSLFLTWYALQNIEVTTGVLNKITHRGLPILWSTLFCFLAILIIGGLGRLGFVSGFLAFSGAIALEVYLIHGPLLIKYNPVFGWFPPDYIAIAYSIFLILLLALASGFNLVIKFLFVRHRLFTNNAEPKNS
jgi:peptidoglycan/LPS O-acetylase OafA/YrhL